MKQKLLITAIVIGALLLRLYGINWDQNQHLHPDERFLTMVTLAEKIPVSVSTYLNSAQSTLNPNNVGFDFYVYGTLPITIAKILAVFFKMDNYVDLTILGRFLSAIVDVGTVLLIYLIGNFLNIRYGLSNKVKYWASFFYAIAVFPIQQGHFFTVDSFLTFFLTAAFYFSLRYSVKQSLSFFVLGAASFAAALASKISALYLLPLIVFFVVGGDLKQKKIVPIFLKTFFYFLITYLFLRFFDPHLFQVANFLNPTINSVLIQNLKQLSQLASSEAAYYPPAVQWLSINPLPFVIKNLFFFGLGPMLFIMMMGGFFIAFKSKKFEINIIVIYLIIFFLYQANKFSPSMRYFLFLYPFFSLFAGVGAAFMMEKKPILRPLLFIFLIVTVLWTASFVTIYSRPHSRVAASKWIYENISPDKILTSEHWDDALPVPLPGYPQYTVLQLPVFAPDTSQKWEEINQTLTRADYIVFSSNRGFGSIVKLPKDYPQMSQFYKNLFADKLPFKKIKEFTSYPSLCFLRDEWCIEFNDQWSEEAFTVYDHPKVIIFQKQP